MDYQIRNIDPELWAKFKAQAETAGLPMKSVLVLLIAGFAHGQIKIAAVGDMRDRQSILDETRQQIDHMLAENAETRKRLDKVIKDGESQ